MGNHGGEQDTGSIHNILKTIEGEVFELEKQESDLRARLLLLQDSIARKRAHAGNLKNSLVPVYCLPDEILLACFGQALQGWLVENHGADEQINLNWHQNRKYMGSGTGEFEWPISPTFVISHVSHRWRHLAVTMPSLWTALIITTRSEHHLDVFRDFLHRINDMPVAADFRFGSSKGMLSDAEISLMEAIMPLIHAQQLTALTLRVPEPVLSLLLSRTMNAPITGSPSSSFTFTRLTALAILRSVDSTQTLTFNQLRLLLSATPQLKSLELQRHVFIDSDEERTSESVINLPKLEKLTIIGCTRLVCKFLSSLSAPDVRQLKILLWYPYMASPFFVNNNGFESPRFPKVQDFTLSFHGNTSDHRLFIIEAFPRVTRITMHSQGLFYQDEDPEESRSPTPLAFQSLEHVTLDFAFEDAHWDPRDCFTWLPGRADQGTPLQIHVFDSSDLEHRRTADRHLFRYYTELQKYGTLDERSTRLDEFLRWQADGEPEL
ncbi:hypothetical protein BJ138DRAFT_1114580 [Hygrophoropsis aurantiaca]|uniref:Uncharacterized protein n=1 Tax=Hygrophoropsis aurantiaca TaxID=72124 RepID=A0ACB8AB10_9AGAM|nr:hypothetical protein BJ138DRAFT_1114580 [Hygrophoropsis aurantiaca]